MSATNPQWPSNPNLPIFRGFLQARQALALGSRGDADVLLTHAPQAEQEFMAAGHGESRRPVMYNDFVLIGPATNPAQLERAADRMKADIE